MYMFSAPSLFFGWHRPWIGGPILFFLGAPILFAFNISIVATAESQEVAVKKFLDQDLSGDALEQFRCEVSINIFEFYVINW